MFVVVFALSLLASVSAESLSISQKGSDDDFTDFIVTKTVIPAGQRTGRLTFKKQYNCKYDIPPLVVKVEVRDEEESATIQIQEGSLDVVNIYRAGPSYSGKAKVTVSVVCYKDIKNDRKTHHDYSANNVLEPA